MLPSLSLPLALRRPGAWLLQLQLQLALPREHYHVMHLPQPAEQDGDGAEFLVLSRHGVFLLHAVDRAGHIAGAKADRMWSQRFPGGSSGFPNPLRQLRRRSAALVHAGGIDPAIVFPAIVFTGGCTFDTPMPANVFGRRGCLSWLRAHDAILLEENGLDRIRERLAGGAIGQGAPAQAAGPACPRCGAPLGAYTYKTGQRAGQVFSGCTRFPGCSYRAAVRGPRVREGDGVSGCASGST